jgi:hypothetical protein
MEKHPKFERAPWTSEVVEEGIASHDRAFERAIEGAKTFAVPLFKRTFIWRLMRPRRFHLFCVGAPKTGTHSVAAIFAKTYRSRHEYKAREIVALTVEASQGLISRQAIARRLQEIDRAGRFEMHASAPLGYFCDTLAETFPKAKFVLTVREPRSWLESKVNHLIRVLHYEKSRFWVDLLKVRYGAETRKHPPEEEALAALELPNLGAILFNYARHTRLVLDSIPRERLLIVRTEDISSSAERLARFAGIPASTLSMEQSHEYRAPLKTDVFAKIDQEYVQAKIDQHCAEIVALHRSVALNAY